LKLASVKTESAITKQLKESAHLVTPSSTNEDALDVPHKVTPPSDVKF